MDICALPFLLIPLWFIFQIVFFTFIKQIMQYEKGVKFRFGKFHSILNPGWNIVIPISDRVLKVDMRLRAVDIPKQEVITKDNVPANINCVVFFRVSDVKKAILKIKDFKLAVAQHAQTAIRDVAGSKTLDEILADREAVAEAIRTIVDEETDEWGIDVVSIKIQDIELPSDMKRAMARQAEAEREKRATIIMSSGELIASKTLQKVSELYSKSPGAIHLRTLQTISDISADQTNEISFVLPVSIFKSFKKGGK